MPSLLPLPLASSDPGTERIAELKTLFPEAFAEGKINFERLRLALGDAVDTGRERYGLSWAGKADAIRAIQIPSAGTLTPDREQSVNFDTTENLIIEGDNLEVLKLLQKSYYGKVKMIYIDPPYNTGNEFIYPDNFREGLQDYLRYSGQVQDDGTLASSTVDKDGRVHSRWLSMMYPRLFLAKNLLRDDGVIFVSIDDHEVHNLRSILDDVFGEECFVASFVWRRRIGSSMAASWVSSDHEYLLIYSRNPEQVFVRGDERDMTKYSISDGEGRTYASMPLTVGMTKDMRPNQWYELKNPTTGTGYFPPNGRVWGYIPSSMSNRIDEGKIIWPEDYPGRKLTTPRLKTYPEDAKRDRKPLSTWIGERNDTGNISETVHSLSSAKNEEGTRVLKSLFDDGVFGYPKPLSLIRTLIHQFTPNDENAIIFDFFAGSGTTAQAVLELNKEDGGNRKFILVQLPEKTNNKQFPTIADITRERVRRVIDKMNAADADKLPIDEDAPDRGFKAFRLTSSNFKVWDGEAVQTDASELAVQLEAFASNILPSATPDAMLYEIMLNAGLEIGASRETVMMGGQVVENIGNGALLVCLEPDIHLATLRAMIAARPRFVVCLDTALHGDDALLTNAELEAKAAGKDNVTFYTV